MLVLEDESTECYQCDVQEQKLGELPSQLKGRSTRVDKKHEGRMLNTIQSRRGQGVSMRESSRNLAFYAVAIVLLIVLAYAVQTDTRRVDGISMLPTLQGGDLVVVQGVPFTDIKVGDIIVYSGLCSSGGESVIHRVVSIGSSGLITKGDNNPQPDQGPAGIATSPITPDCLVGKVVFVVPYVELLAYYIDSQQLPAWVNYVPAAFILLIVLYLILGERDEEDKTTGSPAPKQ